MQELSRAVNMISVFLLVLIIKFVFEEVFQMCIECHYWKFFSYDLLVWGWGGGGVRTHFIDCSYASYSWVL